MKFNGIDPDRYIFFDHTMALDALDGDVGFLVEVIDIYLEDAFDRLAQMRTAIAAGDQTEAERLAHSIKGASLQVAADQVSRVAAEIEGSGRSGRPDRFDSLVMVLARVMDGTREEMNEFVRTVRQCQATDAPRPPDFASPLPLSSVLAFRPRVSTANGESADCLSFM